MRRAVQSGFTLIEVLIAIALLGILVAVLTATLTGSLNLNRQAQQQLGTTTGAQQVLESIRNAWTTLANYDNACAPSVSLPSGYSAQFTNLSTRAEPITQSNTVASPASSAPVNTLNTSTSTSCTASANATLTGGGVPLMRRIIVSTGSSTQDTVLSLDILRPRE